MVKEHIVKGNSVKLLSSPEAEKENAEVSQNTNKELSEKTIKLFKNLGKEEQMKLIKMFVQDSEEND